MSKQEEDIIIGDIITALEGYALGDIDKSRAMNMMLATFILCSCFIDQMAQIRYYHKGNSVGTNFKKFVEKYFAYGYNKDMLYDSLRSRLVHNYSVKGHYLLSDENKYIHLETVGNQVHLNIDDFINDIKTAWGNFKSELLNDTQVKRNAIKHDRRYPVLRERKT